MPAEDARCGWVPPVRSEKSRHHSRGRRDSCLLIFSGRLFYLSNVCRSSGVSPAGDRRQVGTLQPLDDRHRSWSCGRSHLKEHRRRPGTCRGLPLGKVVPLRESMEIKGRSSHAVNAVNAVNAVCVRVRAARPFMGRDCSDKQNVPMAPVGLRGSRRVQRSDRFVFDFSLCSLWLQDRGSCPLRRST